MSICTKSEAGDFLFSNFSDFSNQITKCLNKNFKNRSDIALEQDGKFIIPIYIVKLKLLGRCKQYRSKNKFVNHFWFQISISFPGKISFWYVQFYWLRACPLWFRRWYCTLKYIGYIS